MAEVIKVLYLANAFSISMVAHMPSCVVRITEITEDTVKQKLKNRNFISAVGHPATAEFLTQRLGVKIPANRVMLQLNEGDELIVAQLLQRLPEGAVLTKEQLKKIPMKYFRVLISRT